MGGIGALNTENQNQLTAQQQQIQNDLQVYKDIQMLQGENKAFRVGLLVLFQMSVSWDLVFTT